MTAPALTAGPHDMTRGDRRVRTTEDGNFPRSINRPAHIRGGDVGSSHPIHRRREGSRYAEAHPPSEALTVSRGSQARPNDRLDQRARD